MKLSKVTGLPDVLKNLEKYIKGLEHKWEEGVKLGGLYLQGESMKLVPVDMGPLRESAYTRHTGSGIKTDVTVGYTSEYAVFVHENLDAAHGAEFNAKYADRISRYGARQKRRVKNKVTGVHDPYHRRGSRQQAKFLETPARTKRRQILTIIQRTMQS